MMAPPFNWKHYLEDIEYYQLYTLRVIYQAFELNSDQRLFLKQNAHFTNIYIGYKLYTEQKVVLSIWNTQNSVIYIALR